MIDDATKREAETLAGGASTGDLAAAVKGILATVEREDALCRDVAERHGCPVMRVAEAQSPVNDVAAVRALAGNLMP